MSEMKRRAALGVLADRVIGMQDNADLTRNDQHSRRCCGPVSVAKNSREALRFAIDEYRGRLLLSARVWFQPSDGGDLRPGRHGWAVSIERLPEVIAALQQPEAEAEARKAGLL